MTYDSSEGDRRRDAGIKRVVAAEKQRNPGWSEMALEEIHYTALTMAYFTSDDVRTFVMSEPMKPQAWGPVWKKAARLRWMEGAPEKGKRKSVFPSQHSHLLDVYRSLIFTGDKQG